MDFKLLLEAGLTLWEAKTYVALLELGSTTTGPLVKKAEVPQSKVYEVLNSLSNKGLVTYIIKGKIKYFQASEPKKILSLFREKEKEIEKLIPELESKQILAKEKQSVEIFEGMKAINSLFISLIDNSKRGDEWLSFSIGKDELLEKAHMFFDKIGAFRFEKKLNVKLLDNIKYKKQIQEWYKDRWEYIKKVMRFTESVFPCTTILISGKIIILDILSEPETAIVITNKNLEEQYKNFFLDSWKIAKS